MGEFVYKTYHCQLHCKKIPEMHTSSAFEYSVMGNLWLVFFIDLNGKTNYIFPVTGYGIFAGMHKVNIGFSSWPSLRSFYT